MKIVTTITSLAIVSSCAFASDATHWSYTGDSGPEHWANLTEHNDCGGKNQSPIDITHSFEADMPSIDFHYEKGGFEVVNNGHTIQVNYAAGSQILVDDIPFELKQFHFHSTSEHTVDGRSYPLEAHFVHADAHGNLAVLGLLFEESDTNSALAGIWSAMPDHEGGVSGLQTPVLASDLLPGDRDYYRYNGSLTTPPCTEGVRWLLLKEVSTVSHDQVEAFASLFHHSNNRPVQEVHSRPILR